MSQDIMSKARRHWKIWLAAPAAVAMTTVGLTVPAQAQPGPAARPAAPSATATAATAVTTSHASLRTLDAERPPAGGGRWVVSDPVAYRQALKTGNWVHTPSGLSYSSCIYRAPNHAVVYTTRIVDPSGAVQRITPCTHPMLAYPGSARPAAERAGSKPAVASGPCAFGSGGDYWAASCNGSAPVWLTSFDQEYAVPSDPAKDGALIFLWGGIENAVGNTLLQDVLTWGANGTIVTNPNIWYVTPWYLWPSNNSVIGASLHVNPVDTIVADLTASNCSSGGACTWLMKSTDENTGGSTSYTVGSDATFDLLLGAVMEVPSADGCVETPTGGHAAFRDLTVTGNDGTYTPDFGVSTPDPQCSVSITQESNKADILWKP
jgi:hypothetical protein